MVPDTAVDLRFYYFSSQMRYSSMFRNALSNMSGRLTNVASIAASARIHVNNMRTHFERSNVFESEKVRSPRSRLEVYNSIFSWYKLLANLFNGTPYGVSGFA